MPKLSMTQELSKRAYDAIMDWEKSTGAMYVGGPFFARFFSKEEMVLFEIKNWSEGIQLSLIKTPPDLRGKGLASRALKELLSFADKHDVPVTGNVSPQEDEGPTLDAGQLSKWYTRHGFKVKRGGDMKRPPSAATKVVEALLESGDEIDPKAFSDRLYTLDVRDMKREIEAAIPGIAVVGVHVLKGMLRNEGENREFYVYMAREPRSADGFDPQNYPSGAEQQQADEIIKNWLAVHGCTVLDTRMIATSAMYKNASRCTLTKYYFRTDKDVQIVGHSNDEPLKDVKAR